MTTHRPAVSRRRPRRRHYPLNRLYSRKGLILFLTFVLLLVGWSLRDTFSPEAAPRLVESSAPPQVLYIGLLDSPAGLDPHYHYGATARTIMDLIFERLVYLDASGVPQPALAEEWQISEDGLSVTFRLRPDRYFHDGTAIDAPAVTYTFQRLLEINPPHILPLMGPLQRVEAIGSRMVTLHFDSPYAGIFAALSSPYLGIMSPEAAESPAIDFARAPVGSGPFRLRHWEANGTLTLDRNSGYRSLRTDVDNTGPMHLERLVFRSIPEQKAHWDALQTGAVQLGSAPRHELMTIAETDHPELRLLPWERAHNLTFIEFNHRRPPFDDPRMRQVIAHAIDRESVLNHALLGLGRPVHSCLPVGVFGACEELEACSTYGYDPDRVEELLLDLGYERGENGTHWERDGNPLDLLWWTYTTTNVTRATEAIARQLQTQGITVRSESYDLSTLLARLPEGTHDFNIMRWTWSDPSLLSRLFRSSGWSQNTPGLALDSLLDRLDTTFELGERLEVIAEVQRSLLEQVTMLPLYTDWPVDVYRTEVQGLRRSAEGYWLFHDVRIQTPIEE